MTINPRTKTRAKNSKSEINSIRTREWRIIQHAEIWGGRAQTVVNLSKRASARVDRERDHGIRRCPGLRMLIARAIFCVCSVLHTFQKSCWSNVGISTGATQSANVR